MPLKNCLQHVARSGGETSTQGNPSQRSVPAQPAAEEMQPRQSPASEANPSRLSKGASLGVGMSSASASSLSAGIGMKSSSADDPAITEPGSAAAATPTGPPPAAPAAASDGSSLEVGLGRETV